MRGEGIRLGLLLTAAAPLLAGCGLFLGTVTQRSGSTSCENMAGGACQEQADQISARHRGATQIDLKCSVPTCDRNGGSGTAVVTMPDGTTLNEVFTYVGVQGALPVPICKGLPIDACQNAASGSVDGIVPSKRVVAIEVTCTAPVCLVSKGEADVTISLSDGSKQESGMGWEGAAQP